MFHPYFTPDGDESNDRHTLEGFSDSYTTKPDQFISSDTGGGKHEELPRFRFYPENPLQTEDPFISPGSNVPMNELLNSLTPMNFDLQRPLKFDVPKLPQQKEEGLQASSSVFGIPNNHRPGYNRSDRKEGHTVEGERKELSTEEVVRVAAALFIQTSALISGDPTNLTLPFGLSISNLGADELKNVELTGLLLAAAEKVSNEQYNRANALLRQCNMSTSKYGNAIQRVMYYFSDALQERINRQTVKLTSKGQQKLETMAPEDIIKAVITSHPMQLVANNTLPFSQVLQFTAVQALLDNLMSSKRIHIIDLSIRYGQQWTVFLQGLATRHTCPVESLKISAVGGEEELITMTGKCLSSFAEGLNLPFKLNPVMVPDVNDLREDMFELEEGETIAIYTSLVMGNLIGKPESLENLMRVLQKLNPCLMAVIDIEANHNSQSFISRFTESLFFYSAYFDCFDSLMERNDESRLMMEQIVAQGLKNTISTEGRERVVRYVGVNMWRAYFRRYGLREVDLSERSRYQAQLLVEQFVKDNSCTLEMNCKAMIVKWKGTPLHFISAWKFPKQE